MRRQHVQTAALLSRRSFDLPELAVYPGPAVLGHGRFFISDSTYGSVCHSPARSVTARRTATVAAIISLPASTA
jgi:hypothetical protein